MALIGRLFVIWFAIMLASLAAGMVYAAGLLGPEWRGLSGDVVERGAFWGLTFVASGMTWFAGFLPLAIGVVLAEAFKLRSLLIYVTTGAAMFALGAVGAGVVNLYEESIDRPPPVVPHGAELAAAAGIAFGLVYWLLAGRNAGRWREPRV
jgi:hypothetical protein